MKDSYEAALDKLVQYIDQTVVFAQGQLPEVAEQIIAYGVASSVTSIWIFSIIAVLSMLLCLYGFANIDYDGVGFGVFGFFGLMVSLAFIYFNYMTLIKIEKAPKLYVIQEIRSLTISKN